MHACQSTDSKKQARWGCAGQVFRKLAKKFLVNNGGGLTWACTEWAYKGVGGERMLRM